MGWIKQQILHDIFWGTNKTEKIIFKMEPEKSKMAAKYI